LVSCGHHYPREESPPAEALPTHGRVLPSAAFDVLALPLDAAELAHALVNGGTRPPLDQPQTWLIGETGEGVAVIPCPPALVRWWRSLPLPAAAASAALLAAAAAGELGDLDAAMWLRELIGVRAIAWLPAAD